MAGVLALADPPVAVRVTRSARARRLTLRVASADGSVHLTIPARVPLAEAQAFLADHRDWLAARLAALPAAMPVGHGTLLPLLGRPHRVEPGPGRSPRIEGGALVVPGPAERAGPRAAAFLKALARDRLTEAADRHAGTLRRAPGRITLRDTGSRWGSCNTRGDLMFSWRLVMAPEAVLDYVAAHEAAHLVEMNHSGRFWAVVERLCPGWAVHRAWLRREGAALLRYRFA